jgi:hypothetical protein
METNQLVIQLVHLCATGLQCVTVRATPVNSITISQSSSDTASSPFEKSVDKTWGQIFRLSRISLQSLKTDKQYEVKNGSMPHRYVLKIYSNVPQPVYRDGNLNLPAYTTIQIPSSVFSNGSQSMVTGVRFAPLASVIASNRAGVP